MLSYSQFSYQWKIPSAETDFTQRLCICFQQTCHAWKYFHILYLPVCCCDGKHNIVISQSRLTKVQIGRKTNRWSSPPHQRRDASQMQMSHIQMHLWKHKTDETWEPEQILNPKRSRLSSGDVLGMIARQRLACTDGSSWSPQRSVWTSETHEIAERTEKWLSCVIRDLIQAATSLFGVVVFVLRSCTLEQCRGRDIRALQGPRRQNGTPSVQTGRGPTMLMWTLIKKY